MIVIPKEHAVFRFELPLDDEVFKPDVGRKNEGHAKEDAKPLVFELYGYAFEHRAPDRSTKKFVIHLPPDL